MADKELDWTYIDKFIDYHDLSAENVWDKRPNKLKTIERHLWDAAAMRLDSSFAATIDVDKLQNTTNYLKEASKQFMQEAPIRQQENIARASIDLGLENTPEVIAGGTAKTMRQRQRGLYGGALGSGSIASSLGLNL
jgi:hypothetical protein